MANLGLPDQGWIVLDTNFLIDVYTKQEYYSETLEELLKRENTLVSIDLVRCEFIRSKTKDVVRLKSDFFSKIVESLLPIDKEINKLVQSTIENYGEDIEKVSVTDIYLACTIQRYSQVYLLTRNHQDFPTKLFSRKYIYNVELNKDVRTYGLYQYKKSDVKEITTETEEIPF